MKFRNTFDGLSEDADYELLEKEKMTLLNKKIEALTTQYHEE